MSDVAALILDAAERQSLVALRELGRVGLETHAVEAHDRAPAFASRWCGGSSVVADVAEDPDGHLQALLGICGRLTPKVVFTAHDGTIELLRAHREEFEAITSLALAAEPALGTAIEKSRTLERAEEIGLRVPNGMVVGNVADTDRALRETGLPAVIKPVRSWMWREARGRPLGAGVRRGAIAVTTAEQARGAVAEIVADGAEVLVQEWLPGEREAVSLFYASGRMWARFAQRAERTNPPLGGSSVLRESIPLPADIAPAAERLVIELGLEGYSEVEFRRDADGNAALMEINPRLSASVEIAVRAGVPFPRLLFEWARGGELEPVVGYRTGLRMRWLGGDIAWLRNVLGHAGQPDVPERGAALRVFLSDFAHPTRYDYLDPRDPRPAFSATGVALSDARGWAQRRLWGTGHRSGSATAGAPSTGRAPSTGESSGVGSGKASGSADTEVVVIGAGPYGLSISAHLGARGVRHEIFGSPMESWIDHMPLGMNLKSEGFASNLSDPSGEETLERFCAEAGFEYRDIGLPVRLDVFTAYGRSFQERLVGGLDSRRIERVRRTRGGFELRLSSGDALRCRRVVVATGLLGSIRVPDELAGLPSDRLVHAYDLLDPGEYRGREVAVLGAGQSALEVAVLLHEAGASVRLIARRGSISWNSDPVIGSRSLRERIRYPKSPLGDNLSLHLYAHHQRLIHALPETRRQTFAYTALGPAGAWWLRPRFEGHVEALLGRTPLAAAAENGRVRLRVGRTGGAEEIEVDHVVAGTGYSPQLERIPFLDGDLLGEIEVVEGAPRLDRGFQSTVPGLHFAGYLAGASFGPVMRFVCGADFNARQITRSVRRG